jgi:hypothetical protein
MWQAGNAYYILRGKSGEKSPFRIPGHVWEDIFKIGCRQTGCE